MNIEIAKSVARNTTVQMAQQIITWASSFVLMLFLPRYLGPVDYGRLYLASSLSGIFLILIDFDGRLGVAKRIARSHESTPQVVVNAIGFRIGFWIIAFIGLIIFSLIANYPTPVRILIFIFGLEIIWIGSRTVLLGVFLGYEVMQYSSIASIIERVFVSIVGVSVLLLGANSLGMAIVMVAGTILSFFICAKFAKGIIKIIPKFDWKESLILIKEGIPFLLWTIFGVIYYRVDTVMLSLMTPEAVVGWYGASYKFFDMLAFLPSIYSVTILPILSKLWGKEDKMMAKTTQKSLEFIIIAGIPISIGIFTFSQEIIKLFYGLQAYGPSVLNLQIFAVGILLIYIDMILGTAILACDKQRQWATVAFFAVIVNISLNYFMIPYTQSHFGNGGIGSAIATLITEYFVMICAIILLPKDLLDKSLITVTFKTIGGGIILGGVLLFMHLLSVNWIIQIVIGAVCYILAMLSMKIFNQNELAFIKSSLSPAGIKNAFVLKRGENQ